MQVVNRANLSRICKTDDVLLVAVCDISLMTYHPGLSFIRLIEYLRKIDFLSTSYPKITDAVEELYKKEQLFLKEGIQILQLFRIW